MDSDARSLHASLGQAIRAAEVNHEASRAKRRGELAERRAELEREIATIDAEIGRDAQGNVAHDR